MEDKFLYIQHKQHIDELKDSINLFCKQNGYKKRFKLSFSVYSTIFRKWNNTTAVKNGKRVYNLPAPFVFKKAEIMSMSGVGNNGTYNQCIADLVGMGLITYQYGGKTPARFQVIRIESEAEYEAIFEKAKAYMMEWGNKKTAEEYENEAENQQEKTKATIEQQSCGNSVITFSTAKTQENFSQNAEENQQVENVGSQNTVETQENFSQNAAENQQTENTGSQKTVKVQENFSQKTGKIQQENTVSIARIVYKAINNGRKAIGLDTLSTVHAERNKVHCEKIAAFFLEKYQDSAAESVPTILAAYTEKCTDYEKKVFNPKWIGDNIGEIHDKVLLQSKAIHTAKKQDTKPMLTDFHLQEFHQEIQNKRLYVFQNTKVPEDFGEVKADLLQIAQTGTFKDFEGYISFLFSEKNQANYVHTQQCFNTNNALKGFKLWKELS